jgi:hypothetical protein
MCVCEMRMKSQLEVRDKHNLWNTSLTQLCPFSWCSYCDSNRGQTLIPSSCVFTMNNKASPPCTNASKKCRDLFPYFPSLESRLAGEHTVHGKQYLLWYLHCLYILSRTIGYTIVLGIIST